jgi:hypothetical protein
MNAGSRRMLFLGLSENGLVTKLLLIPQDGAGYNFGAEE